MYEGSQIVLGSGQIVSFLSLVLHGKVTVVQLSFLKEGTHFGLAVVHGGGVMTSHGGWIVLPRHENVSIIYKSHATK